MALSDEKIRKYSKRLLKSRMRILCNHSFFGLLLMHMKFSVDENHPTAYTDAERIAFGTSFLETLSDKEIDFIMLHEIMHVALRHCFRGKGFDPDRFNVACDIVVNSNILLENDMDLQSITLNGFGASMHQTPEGKEGYLFSAEEVYPLIRLSRDSLKGEGSGAKASHPADAKKSGGNGWDDHEKWQKNEDDRKLSDKWVKRVCDAAKAISIQQSSESCGKIPAFAQRLLDAFQNPQIDWRTILNEFVQEEICDYSFSPPDRRFPDSDFFLPDWNEKDDKVENILFMIDTSGSMSDKMITAAFSEVKGAIDQFDGKLQGWLGFFDAAVIEPTPFESEEEFRVIRPVGGGGTNFQIIFEYVNQFMENNPPVSIIILTDGYAPFPDRSVTNEIPVLWLLNNESVNPPWGKIARIKV